MDTVKIKQQLNSKDERRGGYLNFQASGSDVDTAGLTCKS